MPVSSRASAQDLEPVGPSALEGVGRGARLEGAAAQERAPAAHAPRAPRPESARGVSTAHGPAMMPKVPPPNLASSLGVSMVTTVSWGWVSRETSFHGSGDRHRLGDARQVREMARVDRAGIAGDGDGDALRAGHLVG